MTNLCKFLNSNRGLVNRPTNRCLNNIFLAHDKLTLFVPGYAIPPSLAFMLYAALEKKNCDVICIRPITLDDLLFELLFDVKVFSFGLDAFFLRFPVLTKRYLVRNSGELLLKY